MPQQPANPMPKAASPRFGASFDPWNSSATGHQRPDSQPGTGWRESRNKKLNSQFRGGSAGGERMSDTWGAGSADWDEEKKKAIVPGELRERKGRTVKDMLMKPGRMRESLGVGVGAAAAVATATAAIMGEEGKMEARRREDEKKEAAAAAAGKASGGGRRGIFDGVVVYVNGSTYPLISDHKLKHILSDNGAQMSLHLGRRRVTHVIVGRPAAESSSSLSAARGAGGGLASGKIEKEIRRVGGCGVKFVSVEWVLESLQAGRRLPEAGFSNMKLAAKGQNSVYGLYSSRRGGSTAGTG